MFAIPGCYGSGNSEAEALANVRQAIFDDSGHCLETVPTVVERWRAKSDNDDPDFLINALFDDDRRPLEAAEVEEGITRLKQNRRRLSAVLEGRAITDEAARILRHMATAERWYLDELGLATVDDQPSADPIECLQQIRACLLSCLPDLVGSDLYANRSGEGWTARKLLRRAIWHERDHTQQIQLL